MPSTRQSNAKAYDRVTSGSRPSNGQQSQFGFDASFLTQFLNNEKVRDTDIRELWIEEPRVVRQLVVWRRRCFDSDEHRTWLTQNGQYKLEERRLPSFIQEIGEYVANTPTTRLKFEPDPDLDHDTPYSRAHEFKQMWGYTAYQIANNSSRVSVFREARQSEKGDRNLGTESNVHFTRWCYEQAAALIMSCFQDLNQHSDGYFKRLLDAWTGPGPTTNNDSPISWDKVDSDGPKRTITGTPSSIKRTYSERYPNSSAITPTKPPSSSRRTSTRPPSLSEGDSDGDNEIRQKRQRGSEAQQDMLHPGVAISEANVLSSIESDTSSSLFNGQNASNASTVVVVEPESGTLESSVPRQETINAYQTPEQDSDAKPSTDTPIIPLSVSRYSDTLNASALVEPDYWKNQCREKQHEIADLKVEVEDLTRTLVTERQEHEERRSALDDARNEMQQLRIDLDKTQTELQQSNADVRTLEENLRQFGSAIAKAVREHYPEA